MSDLHFTFKLPADDRASPAIREMTQRLVAEVRRLVRDGGDGPNPDEHSPLCDLVLVAEKPDLIRGCGCYRKVLDLFEGRSRSTIRSHARPWFRAAPDGHGLRPEQLGHWWIDDWRFAIVLPDQSGAR